MMLASCSAAPRAREASESRRSIVLLAAPAGPRDFAGPIQGTVRCDEAMPAEAPCLAEDLTLAQAVLACGPVEATIDRGTSHYRLVSFPAGLRERFPAMSSDLDIVRCVQGRVGFSFSAVLAAEGAEALDGDSAPFETLHSKGSRAK